MEKFESHYFADFETTSIENWIIDNEVRVFMWSVRDIHGFEKTGTDMNSFIDYSVELARGRNIYMWFHNLKFDFSFIEWQLLFYNYAQFKQNMESRFRYSSWGKEYTVVRDDMNNVFGADWYTEKKSMVKFRDSAKIFPMTLERLGGMMGVAKLTENFDYETYRPMNYTPTDKEWEYMSRDTEILLKAMKAHFYEHDKTRMTRSSYAFAGLRDDYNENNTPKNWAEIKAKNKYKKNVTYFDHVFPTTTPELYRELQDAYAGGIVYVNPKYRSRILEKVVAFDVNSEYPAAMLRYLFPKGDGVKFEGYYGKQSVSDKKKHPLYIQKFSCEFELRDNGFPMLPKKISKFNKVITSSEDLISGKIITLSNVDLEHFFKNYNVDMDTISFYGGYMWEGVQAPFKTYIEAQAKKKIQAEENADKCKKERLELEESGKTDSATMNKILKLKGQEATFRIEREMAKLNMNGCYGKFAQSPFRGSKVPYIDDKGVLRYKDTHEDPEGKNYFPMAIFITAYARDILLKGVYAAGVERVMYVDTDSIHLLGHETPDGLPVHKTKMGYWSCDGKYDKAIFLRDKFYGEMYYNDKGEQVLLFKGAGISDTSRGEVTNIEDIQLSKVYEGNLSVKMVKGGTLLINRDKYVKPDRELATEDELKRDDAYQEAIKENKKKKDLEFEKEVKELKERLTCEGLI